MTASRVKRAPRDGVTALAVLGVTAWAVLAAPVAAWGQTVTPAAPVDLSAPLRLVPPTATDPASRSASTPGAVPNKPPPQPGGQPFDVLGVGTTPSVLQPSVPQPSVPQPGRAVQADPAAPLPVMGGAVDAESLSTISPDVAGVLSVADGGFGATMWQGTPGGILEQLLPQLPVTSASPTMRDLMRRLLLTGAEVPSGGTPGSLIALRAGLLSAMGDFVAVKSLLAAVPGRSADPDLLRVEVDARFLTGDVARACQLANAYIQEQQSTYWQKAFIFCQALEGDGDAALLGISLLEELGVNDPVFFQLMDALVRENEPDYSAPVIDSLADPTPLQLALARVAKVTLPSDVIASNRPGVLRAIAISPNAPPQLRLEAAERAEAAGALPVDALRQLYASIAFSKEDLDSPLSRAAQLSGPMSRALLYRATLMQTLPAAQAEALQQVLALARQGGRYGSSARAFLPQLTRIPATLDLAWFAPEAIRAYLISGRTIDAAPWFAVLQDVAGRDPKMSNAQVSLMPVAWLAGFEGAATWTTAQLPDWWKAIKDSDGARDKAATLAAILQALGEPVPDAVWADLIAGTSHTAMMAPYPSYWFLLDSAARANRVGETVLLSLVSLGDGGPARADPIVLNYMLNALGTIGLVREVRAMALEAVVAAGL